MRVRLTWSRLCLLAVLVIGAVLRLRGISGRAFWLDEAFTVRLAQFDWSEVVTRSAADNHPPLFYLILKAWMAAFGDSPLALRSLDVMIGVSTIGLVYALARRVFGTALTKARASHAPEVAATIAALWIAIHPTHVLWTAQVRMYALAGMLAVISALLLLRALEQPTWRRWAAWSVLAILLAYTHYFGAFVVLAQGLHAVVCALRAQPAQRRLLVIRVVAAGVLIAVAFAPWIGIAVAQSASKRGAWWVPPLTPSRLLWAWSRIPGLQSENEFETPEGGWAVVVGLIACALAVATITAAAARDRGLRLVAWCTLIPLGVGVAVSLVVGENVVLARYLIVAEVFVPIVIVGMVYRHAGHRLAPAILAPIVAAVIASLAGQLPLLGPQPDVPDIVEWMSVYRRAGDIVVIQQFHYWSFRIRVPDGDPRLRMYAQGRKPLPYHGVSILDEHDRVWGSTDLANVPGRLIVIESDVMPVAVPPARFKMIRSHRSATSIPDDQKFGLRIAIYERQP